MNIGGFDDDLYSQDNKEESKLLKKFQDYKSLEKQISKKGFFDDFGKGEPSLWGKRFLIASILQGSIITGITLALLFTQFVTPNMNFIQHILAFDGTIKLFVFGYFVYLILAIVLAITGIFYHHLETNMKKQIQNYNSILAWIHLVGTNSGGAFIALSLILIGLFGVEYFNLVEDPDLIHANDNVVNLSYFIMAFIGVFALGLIAGAVSYLNTYMKKDLFENL